MKWIGQNIWDYISRFRNDIYLEDVSSGTIASGGNLGLDSNNKIVKATVSGGGSGDIEGVTAGTGLSGGGTSGTVTLNVSGLTVSEIAAGSILVAGETFADNDTSLMSAAAINDRIESFGYTTNTGDITGVDLTGSSPVTINSETGTTSGNYSATIGVDAASTSGRGVVELATTAETTTGTDANRAVTPDGLKDGYQGSANVTTLGTVSSGTWQGTAIASAYLDADTAHYSATRQVTHHMITDDVDAGVVFISLGEIDAENTAAGNKYLPLIAPSAGKLLKIFARTTANMSSETFTWKLHTRTVSQSTNGNVAEIGAQSGAGPTNKTMETYDFTTGLDSGTNVIAAGDKVQISIEVSDGTTANSNYFITCLWEWDLS